jgi:hypothetical protein
MTSSPTTSCWWSTGRRSPRPADLGAVRSRDLFEAGRVDLTLGIAVAFVGFVEAVAVCDGRFTPVLRCTGFPRPITLELTEDMRELALDSLCREVVADGRLYSTEADCYRLEVYRLQAAPHVPNR